MDKVGFTILCLISCILWSCGELETPSFNQYVVEAFITADESVYDIKIKETAALDDDSICVLDARPMPRFRGSSEEPRSGLRRGHMPGALNLPFPDLFQHGLFRSKSELEQILQPLVGDAQACICSCGSGVTACILAFALHYIGDDRSAVYDGSWCEWGLPGNDLPVVVDD